VTFKNNRSHAGGGMNNNASSPSLTDVAFINNYGYDAGGMNNENASSPSLVNVTFSGNTATESGGGMINYYHSDASLENVSFSNNSTGISGGGMYNYNSLPTLRHVIFRGNTAALQDTGYGGGMFNYESSPTLVDVTFQENTAVYEDFAGGGGGMYNFSGSSPSLSGVTFVSNWAYEGGGMFNTVSSSPSFEMVIFRQNIGLVRGGGMLNENGSSPDLKDVDFDHNQANFGSGMLNTGGSNPSLLNVSFYGGWGEEGGGMLNSQSSPTLVNVTFTDNTVLGGFGLGGAISNHQSNPILTNVTISGNVSDDEGGGGGIYNDQSNPVITNSIVYGNTEGNIVNDASSPDVSYSIVEGGYAGTGNLDANPLLGSLQDNGGFTPTMALGAGSPAIDAANDTVCPAADQRGVPRPQGAHCDMGVFEYEQPVPKTIRLPSQAVPDGWILEASEDGGTGGSMNSTAETFRLGDDAADRQYRAILSFNTAALPDHAVITGARLRIRWQGLVGTDPFTTHGWLRADIRKGVFSKDAALQLTDFNASASRGAVATFGKLPFNGWYTAKLSEAAFPYINAVGTTQFRLRFSLDDNDDRGADFMRFYSGNAAENRPVLIITYYVP
jgi:hypothetical protein